MAPGANGGARPPSSKPGTGRLPHCAGKDIVNPGSVILSGVMTLEIGYGWNAVTLPEETGRNGEHKHRPAATLSRLYSTLDIGQEHYEKGLFFDLRTAFLNPKSSI